MGRDDKDCKVSVLTSSQSYFSELVDSALEKRKLTTSPYVSKYLVGLLEANLVTENMTLNSTLAEALLSAYQADKPVRIERLKRVADTSLYVSGFFGDSLRRKIIDIDYYADIGGAAYANLAQEVGTDIRSQVYLEFSKRFLEYVDLLTFISQNSLIQSNQDLLRLYERYVITGSELAKEQLIERGLLVNDSIKKSSNQ